MFGEICVIEVVVFEFKERDGLPVVVKERQEFALCINTQFIVGG